MIVPDSMEVFMNNRVQAEAASLEALISGGLQVQDLLTGAATSHIAVASAVVSSDVDEVVVNTRIVSDEFEASNFFDESCTSVNVVDLLLI